MKKLMLLSVFSGWGLAMTPDVSLAQAAAAAATPSTTTTTTSTGLVNGYDYGYGYPAGGTIFGNNTRAIADVIRAEGIRDYYSGAGAVYYSEAQRQFIQNRKAAVDTYFTIRQANAEFRARERGRRGTYEDWVRYAQASAPARLTPAQLDRVSGRICWPVLLRADVFSPYRAEMEKLFAFRAVSGQLTAEEFLRIDELSRLLSDDLQSRVALLPAQEYVQAKRFVQSLNYEASLPPV